MFLSHFYFVKIFKLISPWLPCRHGLSLNQWFSKCHPGVPGEGECLQDSFKESVRSRWFHNNIMILFAYFTLTSSQVFCRLFQKLCDRGWQHYCHVDRICVCMLFCFKLPSYFVSTMVHICKNNPYNYKLFEMFNNF